VTRTWPQDWEKRRSGIGCEGCEQGRPEEDGNGVRFFAGQFADAYLKRVAPVNGYSTVMFRGRHVADPVDLTPEEMAGFWADVRVAAKAIEAVFRPCHLNYQLLGNSVPHVHVHLLPRYLDDPDPERPLGATAWARETRVAADTLQSQVSALKAAAAQLREVSVAPFDEKRVRPEAR
jgi:diadenosine tetraphosphate (Ap4A) HIT family hydrolase